MDADEIIERFTKMQEKLQEEFEESLEEFAAGIVTGKHCA